MAGSVLEVVVPEPYLVRDCTVLSTKLLESRITMATTHSPGASEPAAERTPLIILAGAEYGSGSSRDWAAKGTMLLGVKAVIATSYERIHRSNLIGVGVLPLQFQPGESTQALGLSGEEIYTLTGLHGRDSVPNEVTVRAERDGQARQFRAVVRLDTPAEATYYRHGGILRYVLRHLAAS